MISEIRSLLHEPEWSHQQRNEMWKLLEESYTQDPGRHSDHIYPYLQGFPRHWERGARGAQTLEEVQRLSHVCPLGKISFRARLDEDALTPLLASPYMTQVATLNLNNSKMTEEHFKMLGDSPYTGQIKNLILRGIILTEISAEALLSSSYMLNVKNAYLEMQDLSPEQIAQLRLKLSHTEQHYP